FDDLASSDATEVLKIAPTPSLGAGLSLSKIASALRRGGRQRRIDERAVEITSTMTTEIANLATALEAGFEQPPAAKVVRSLPGLGTILGARVLGEFGDNPDR